MEPTISHTHPVQTDTTYEVACNVHYYNGRGGTRGIIKFEIETEKIIWLRVMPSFNADYWETSGKHIQDIMFWGPARNYHMASGKNSKFDFVKEGKNET